MASRSEDVPVVALNGVSKVYYAPGWRIGYMALHDPTNRMGLVRDGLERLARVVPPHPLKWVISPAWSKTVRDGNLPERALRQRDHCLKRIAQIDGLEVEQPGGAFYMFVRLTDERWANDDKAFVLQLLHEEHVLLVHGSGFSPQLGKGHGLVYFW